MVQDGGAVQGWGTCSRPVRVHDEQNCRVCASSVGPAAQQDLVPAAPIPTLTAAADGSNRVIVLIIWWTEIAIGQPSSARE